ncbi:aldolase/citrate lyase family protein [Oceanobacillus profundus]|uniref:Aldolase n=1 Tax=Oceanobacillus profundus TaxID=372463 RepID=A0A417YCA4_9BACI|nr:aldolase/citrate lyase family protein [Oceanobacillus profundus]MCM3399824.1 aldolase/citrate lyase family protein [Oceanobacillus profundus]MDO6451580.1 aldolase/citrate lyase family protein [Oceanobacillus profundus]PAE30311.1 aldolase [Paenibacillus sp. 7884-2]RHW30322.1 aldolase [Oceanobacillus profundus]
MFYNQLKRRWSEPTENPVLSVFVGFPSTQIIEMAALSQFDVIVIDNEHGMHSYENIENMVIAAENKGITPLVRTSSSDPSELLKVMDRGAHGVHVPQVDSKEQAERIVEAVKYPPLGKRGAAFSMRAADYGNIPIQQYLEKANQETLIGIHIESEKAMVHLNEILSVKEIDMVYIGPTDLSVSLGYGGSIDHPEVLKTIDNIYETAKTYGVKVGIHTKDRSGALMRKNWGADYVGITVTSLINQSFKHFTNHVIGSLVEK